MMRADTTLLNNYSNEELNLLNEDDKANSLDYYLISILDLYQDTRVINSSYLDDLSREFNLSSEEKSEIIKQIEDKGYQIDNADLNDELEEEAKEEEKIANGSSFDVSSLESSKITDSLKLYFKDIGRYKLLTREEEKMVCMEIEKGNEDARDDLLNANLRLVVSIAKHYLNHGLPLLDLIQEGNLGLMKAAIKFDYKKGNKFSTYAIYLVRQAIRRGIDNNASLVRIPAHVREDMWKINKTREQLIQDLGREPTAEEIHQVLDEYMSIEKITEYLSYGYEVLSLNATINDEDETTIGDLTADENEMSPTFYADRSSYLNKLAKYMNKYLNKREKEIYALRKGLVDDETHTLEEIADRYGVTRERIRQIEVKAEKKLKPYLKELE